MVKENGVVTPAAGGVKIIVYNPLEFPWCEVLTLLVDLDQDVWVSKREGILTILSKPPSV
ncbi:MAG: hypothetical protein Q6362_012010 [Candidatus Wukongarchaeota archaeon]|nr:hypothetical protein [Candidatus Wukongarchaeota archaeon]